MNVSEPLRDVENLRFRIQMNNRLRLECLAAVSKVFREFREPINDELLSSIVFALPQELFSGNGRGKTHVKVMAGMDSAEIVQMRLGNPPEEPQPELPPEIPVPGPGMPPQGPEPELPSLPPDIDVPALPPQQPEQLATT